MKVNENAPGSWSQQGVMRTTDSDAGHDPKRKEPEVPLPANDEAPVDEEMIDVDVNNSVSSEHPEAGKSGRVDDPGADTRDEKDNEPRGMPASDPESGA
ncbi:hypothetical protein [Pseudomonas chlororaphis]|uniref:Uncharacterized protein n=1 Tax=Pseudomonas chlororaphis subsp. aurantiaca TaxID=86192 RepID=A0AAJ0ZJH7_9PSED|nr:hypothetical protein [Pseudomonas chlororaphis subsp. aurantiaca]BAV74229.1 hypothetical protein PCAU_2020 [Pseudomonas chlororaphis subsp. aurantiaca]